jgi:hypothetical protein
MARASLRRPVLTGATLLVALVMWGGYHDHWRWTGLNGRTATLWDWLHLLALPFAVSLLPLLLSRRTRVPRRHKVLGTVLLLAFAALVPPGYLVPWKWTGFAGNRLWDWLELLALPLAVALAPLVGELRERWSPRHTLLTAIVLTAFVVVVLGGYLGHWRWTGFRGNTLWNWLQLWLLPLLIPAVLVPALKPRAMAGVVELEDGEDEPAGMPPGAAVPVGSVQPVPPPHDLSPSPEAGRAPAGGT